MNAPIKVGTILVNSIGCGCDVFYEVIRSTPKTVKVREIHYVVVKCSRKNQTHDIKPIPGAFREGGTPLSLRIAADGRIGPQKRMIWWRVYDGKPLDQYSS
jgi:hypothetical protein